MVQRGLGVFLFLPFSALSLPIHCGPIQPGWLEDGGILLGGAGGDGVDFQGISTVVLMCLVAQFCPTLCDTMDCSPPGSSMHGISQSRILEWVAIFLLQGIFLTRGLNPSFPSLLHCRWILYLLSYEAVQFFRSFPPSSPHTCGSLWSFELFPHELSEGLIIGWKDDWFQVLS